MTNPLFTDAISLPALSLAFARVQSNGGGPGGDGNRVENFALNVETRLSSLHWSLRHGLYRSGPLRRVDIPKKSGGTRTLAIPCVVDRVVQTAVATTLTPVLDSEFNDSSYAYRAGKSVKQAVSRVELLRNAGYPWVVDGDIRAFFDEVPHDPLIGRLRKSVDEPPLLALIDEWLDGFGPGVGLAQGSPLSPLLANLWLDGLDDLFADGPVRIVRFADDFVLLSKTHKSAEAALDRARRWLGDHGLVLHPDKTRIVPFEGAFDYLGHLFVRSVVIKRASDTMALGPKSIRGSKTPQHPDFVQEEADAQAALVRPEAGIAAAKSVPIPEDPLKDLAADRSVQDFALGLAPLYIMEKDRRISTANECFTVFAGEAELLRIPAHMVGRVDLGPNGVADPAALRMAADHAIPFSLVNGLGAAQAVLLPALSDYAGLHLAQARLMLLPERALAQVRLLVAGKLRNGHALLKRLNRRRKFDQVENMCLAIKRLRARAGVAISVDQARGFEGEGAKLFYAGLSLCFEHGFALPRRRDDPGNPVTGVLNYTASLLTRDMMAAVLRAGLHPGFGVLHAGADYRDACVWDLIEAFRAPLAEGLTVYLFNNRVLGDDDFTNNDGVARLTGTASRRLVETYEAWLARPIKNPRTGQHTTWRGLLLLEARAFASALRDGALFTPYAMDH